MTLPKAERMVTHVPRSAPARLLAFLLPALVLVGWAVWTHGVDDRAAVPQAVSQIDAILAAKPEVVVLGNSASFLAIDEVALGAALGFPGRVAKIAVPGSRSPAWYAILANRVIQGGHKPRLVIVPAPLHQLLDTRMDEQQAMLLRQQMGLSDAVIERKAFGARWAGVTSRSREAAERWFAWPKLVALGALWGDGAGTLAEQGRAVAGPALGRAYAHGATDVSLYQHAGPLAVGVDGAEASALSVEGSMVGDIADLAAEAGIRVVFVSVPLPAANPTPRPGREWQERLVELLHTKNAGWIDLSDAALPSSAWIDSVHLGNAGRTQLTALLVDALREINPLGKGAAGGLSAVITRLGTPDPLPELSAPKADGCKRNFPSPRLSPLANKDLFDKLGIGNASPVVLLRDGQPLRPHVQPAQQACDDTWIHGTGALAAQVTKDGVWSIAWSDAAPATGRVHNQEVPVWWVYPGTTLHLAFDSAWDASLGAPVVQIDAALSGPGGLAITAGDVSAVLSSADGGGVTGRLVPAPATGPWSIDLSVVSGGAPAVIKGVTVGEGAKATSVLGERGDGNLRILGAGHPARTVLNAAPPPSLPIPPQVKIDQTKGAAQGSFPRGRIKLDLYAELAPGLVLEKSSVGACSPLQVTEDGELLGPANAALKDVQGVGMGRWAAQPGGVLLTASDNSDPTTNGRAYAVSLNPDRQCKDAVWLYPGDVDVVTLDPLGRLPQGATALDLAATPFISDPKGAVHVRLEVDGKVRYEDDVPVTALKDGARLPLVPAVAGGAKKLVLTMRSSADMPFLLVTSAALVAPEAEPLARSTAPPPAPPPAAGTIAFDLSALRQNPKETLRLIPFDASPGDSVTTPVRLNDLDGLRFQAVVAASSRLCTSRFAVHGPGTARAHLRLVEVVNGSSKHQTLRVDATFFGADKQPLRVDDKVVVQGVDVPPGSAWSWVELPVQPPEGAAQVQVCVRFAKSSGTVEIDRLEAQGSPL